MFKALILHQASKDNLLIKYYCSHLITLFYFIVLMYSYFVFILILSMYILYIYLNIVFIHVKDTWENRLLKMCPDQIKLLFIYYLSPWRLGFSKSRMILPHRISTKCPIHTHFALPKLEAGVLPTLFPNWWIDVGWEALVFLNYHFNFLLYLLDCKGTIVRANYLKCKVKPMSSFIPQ